MIPEAQQLLMNNSLNQISTKLQDWYQHNKRDLPWRNTSDHYKIWVSEIILQQTRVNQGLSYYLRFIEEYPTIKDLAVAKEEELLKLWQGLGYYSRARNMLSAAKQIMQDFDGLFPTQYQQLLKLKGVGEYTAAAIASIGSREPVAVIDGNVQRVLSRLFLIEAAVDEKAGSNQIKKLAEACLDSSNPGDSNQALMELGALVCTPKNTRCPSCPVNMHCLALQHGKIEQLPIKVKKLKRKKRYFNYVLFTTGRKLLIHKRGEGDVWRGLFEPTLFEAPKLFSEKQLIKHLQLKLNLNLNNFNIVNTTEEMKHVLTHQDIFAKLGILEIDSETMSKTGKWIEQSALNEYPVPVLVEKLLKKAQFL